MKPARILSVCVLLAVFAGAPRAFGGWFDGETKKSNTPTPTVNKKGPSVFQKIGDGTKKFFDGVGNTLGLNKKAPKPNPYHTAWNTPPKQPEKKGFLDGLFAPKQPEKPKTQTPSEWLGNPKPEW